MAKIGKNMVEIITIEGSTGPLKACPIGNIVFTLSPIEVAFVFGDRIELPFSATGPHHILG